MSTLRLRGDQLRLRLKQADRARARVADSASLISALQTELLSRRTRREIAAIERRLQAAERQFGARMRALAEATRKIRDFEGVPRAPAD